MACAPQAKSARSLLDTVAENRLTHTLATLAPGQVVSDTFQAQVVAEASQALTSTLSASGPPLSSPLRTQAVLQVVAPAGDEAWAGPDVATRLQASDGRVSLQIPAGAVRQRVRLRYQPLAQFPNPDHNILFAFTLTAADEGGQVVSRFAQPVQLSYQPEPGRRPEELAFFSLDESTRQWTPLPTEIDAAQGRLQASLAHFSTYAVGSTAIPEAAPGIVGVQAQLYTGSVTVDYALEAPPGPGGLTPNVGVSYTSGPGDGHQSVLGSGWSLPVASYILRNPKTWDDPAADETQYLLVLNGVTHEIVEKNGTLYSRQDPGLHIVRTAQETPEYSLPGATLEVFRTQTHSYEGRGLADIMYRDLDSQGWNVSTADGLRYHFRPATYDRRCTDLDDDPSDDDNPRIFHRFDKWVLSSVADNNFGTADEPHTPNRLTFSYAYRCNGLSRPQCG